MAKPLLSEYEGLELSDDKSLQPLDVVRSGNQIRVILHSTGEIVGAIDATKLKHLFNSNDLNCDIPSTSDNPYRSLEEEHESFGNSKFSMSRYMSFAAPPSLSVDTTEYFDKLSWGAFGACAVDLGSSICQLFSQYVQQQLTYSMERNTKVATFMTLIIGAAVILQHRLQPFLLIIITYFA